jgi:hypothetical protein
MRNIFLLVVLLGSISCGKKNKEATTPLKRNMEILDEEDLEHLPES